MIRLGSDLNIKNQFDSKELELKNDWYMIGMTSAERHLQVIITQCGSSALITTEYRYISSVILRKCIERLIVPVAPEVSCSSIILNLHLAGLANHFASVNLFFLFVCSEPEMLSDPKPSVCVFKASARFMVYRLLHFFTHGVHP